MFRRLTALATVLAVCARRCLSEITLENVESVTESTLNLHTHSIFAPYVDQDLQNRWFSFGADAYINTNKHIRLTQDRPSQTGWLWSRLPITVPNFQIEVEFKITSSSGHLFGDGMAIWLTTRRAESGPVFGFEDKFEGLGIFIDTFANERHSYGFPRILGMIGDGNTHYDNGKDGHEQAAGACTAQVRQQDIATKLRITVLKNHFVNVEVHYRGWDEWTPCFTIEKPKLPPAPFLGVTALTGEVSEAHDVISITASGLIINADKLRGPETPIRQKHRSSSSLFGGFFRFLLKLVFLGIILAVAYVGYIAYVKKYGSGKVPWDAKRF
ncbi:legume-like lectin family-domain-containing protein [Cantharellus anzutake]|uniref:legume-like lectin family-domain-containing protein n=1 Tax=Cantharellus anzutake TaxID=1750568 RepID=UPI001906C453|nr:legume-like lectin family-domain-containing protein [Cantharellus anzutake]KAF8331376.1 legume-like lectin family-domain-containing protein [Cantharellus anzutake]